MSAPPSASNAPVRLRFGRWRAVSDDRSTAGVVEWVLQRNCSTTPAQMTAFYGSLCVVSLGIGSFFWAFGATLVMPFAWAELLLVGAALVVWARHATDRERIALAPGRLTVEWQSGGRVERAEFQPDWVRVEPCHDDRSLIELSGQGRSIAVGRYVRPELRRQLAEEFRAALRSWPQERRPAAAVSDAV
ncbi:DUF2244 domain-containing protein [Rivibacter subsaxonicus]|uniref:Putative membrane protein n=1 Tax=Rivibacter subsaxonicus TaxID=457575 RepID=A0A4Q7VGM3_9BURK|nr:DUF2244 domain-containing protein [Rivibacter subsaxonicus]RZT95196.1 putative membrane protein [Rivibacter subsaxonicus]